MGQDAWYEIPKKRKGVQSLARVIYARTAGPDRAAPAKLPLIRHDEGEIEGELASTEKIFPAIPLLPFIIDTYWSENDEGFSVFENDEDSEATLQSICAATGVKDFEGDTRLQMFGAATCYHPGSRNELHDTGNILLFQAMFGYSFDPELDGSLQYWIAPADLKAGKFEMAWALSEFD
jgi:hypothetical protein